MKTFKIGNVIPDNPLILAPMAGVSDLPFRMLCKECGAGLVYTEMVSAKAILFGNKNTEKLMEIDPGEHPVSLQLFGSEPDIMREAVKRIGERPFDILDINMGCPVPKVVNNHEGSALMKDPARVGAIVSAVARATDKPVTVKIRKGFDDEHVNAVEIAKIIEDAGGAAVAVHGRTRAEFYSGEADWEIIKSVKEAVSIPVIGNGDANTPERVAAMLAQTGCDGVMIARAARGNPWIFARTLAFLQTGELPPAPDKEEVRACMLRHVRMQIADKGDYTGIREMRKHIAWYTAGFPHSAKLRSRINEVSSVAELEEILVSF